MANRIARRDFLRTASAAAGALTYVARGGEIDLSAAQTSAFTPVADYPIQPKRYSDVVLNDAFWKPKVDINARVTIPIEVAKLTDGGRGFGGNVLEAAIMSLKTHPNPQLQAQVDARVRELAERPDAGNNGFEVAATYFATTGRRDLLDPAIRTAAAIRARFQRDNPPFSGGERDAMNCVQLYRVTHDKTHLELAKHYLDIRGLANSVNRSRHNQSYKPVLEQAEAVGHAVNCVTLIVSLADVGVLTGLTPYFTAAERMWRDAAERKMYVTGGVGTTGNEGFGEPYSLPNISAYSETCAVLMFMTLNHRLFLATGDGKYIDVMERGMYNNAIDGISAAGDRFFYVNRLASAGDGRDLRWERASLECCPPNLVRFLAQMPGYIYAQDSKGAIFVNLYVSSETSFTVGGRRLTLSMKSDMPWGGKSRLQVSAAADVAGTIKLRIPAWARSSPTPGRLYSYANQAAGQPAVSVNGTRVPATPDRFGYVTIDRVWKTGDAVEVEFPIEPRTVVADTRVKDTAGRVAVERGPIVYCAEWPDIDGGRVLDVRIEPTPALRPVADPNLYGGATVITTEARSLTTPAAPARPLKLIPYYLWANRGAGEMTVWLPTRDYVVGDVGPAGGFIFHVNPNSAADGWRYLEAAPFDQSAGASWGCFRTEIPGAAGTAIGTGRRNTADMLACAERGSAADLCAHLKLNGVTGWFLPSRDELVLMYKNLKAAGLGDFVTGGVADNFTYWASSQQTTDMSVHVDFADLGRVHGDDKDFPRRVRAIRAF